MFENRRYVIIPSSSVESIDFSKVMETSPRSCRYSLDGSKTFVKYNGNIPEVVSNIIGRSKEYTHSEFLDILSTEEWTLRDYDD